MFEHVSYQNDFFDLIYEETLVYIRVKQKGYSVTDFQTLLKELPRIKITQFVNLKTALGTGMAQIIQIGELKDEIEVSISKDRLTAYALINLSVREFEVASKRRLIDDIVSLSKLAGISFGMDFSDIMSLISPIEKFIIARGKEPTAGADAVIRLFEIEDVKPLLVEDGNVNHYELNLINKVAAGAWLGERTEPKEGIPGRTVLGEILPALHGKQERLLYDRKSVKEVFDPQIGVTTLIAGRTGAVVYENGLISVCNYLEINGKVSFETGNIDFDGYVDVKDSVEDNFSIKADHDIQVMGNMGIGGVDSIESREGSIYIRGGIAGKNKAQVICNGNLYTKFAADCTILCNGTVHIGYYAMNCNIKAKQIILENYNSKIIGGNLEAEVQIVAGEIGSRAEPYTCLSITGFDRNAFKEQYDMMNVTIEKLKQSITLLKQKIAIYALSELDAEKKAQLNRMESEYESCQKTLKVMYEKRKQYISYLNAKGEGEIRINKGYYPNVHLTIKGSTTHLFEKKSTPQSYYSKGAELFID